MRKFTTILFFAFFSQISNAQTLKNILNKAVKKDSTGKISLPVKNNTSNAKAAFSNDEIISGLKEALRVATDSTTKTLSLADGFFGNNAIKLLMPTEAVKVEKTLRSFGAGALVDKAILSMNRAAEDAAKDAGSIFVNAIKQMTLTDGLAILKGSNNAATEYLKKTSTTALTEKMRPVIEASLKKVNATQYWNDLFKKYNMFSKEKVETDLTTYVTTKALSGLFLTIAQKEESIRKDPTAQVTDILKKVFSK